jgi:hypothetical protein
MDKTQYKHRLPLRFLLIGGFTGTLGSTICSIGIALLDICAVTLYDISREGSKSFHDSLSGDGFLWFLFMLLSLMLLISLISFIPAFIAGAFLAWLLRNETPTQPSLSTRYIKSGAAIGAVAGTLLAMGIFLPGLLSPHFAHGGFGHQPGEAILSSILRGVEIICASSLTGAWVAKQLRLRISLGESPAA